MLTGVVQEGKGVGDQENEEQEEIVTPRDQWKQVPRKGKFSLKYVNMWVHAIINKEMEKKLTISVCFQAV